MIGTYQTFRSLERERYVSPAWFEREMSAIHGRCWLYGCHLSEIPGPGSFVLRAVPPNESIIIVHGSDGKVRALFNVCRHRGSRICDDVAGTVGRLRCPYHNWTYGLDGTLLVAPQARDGDNFSYFDYGLDQAHVEVWKGHVFINLGPGTPEALAPRLGAAAPDLEAFQPTRHKVAARRTYSIAANWKLVMENFWECYHCPTGHREFCFAADVAGLNESDFGDLAGPGEEVPLVIEGPLPLKPGMRTLSVDGAPVCNRALGDFHRDPDANSRAATTGFLLRHCTAATYFEDHAFILDFQPIDVARTDLVTRWLVHEDAIEGRDYEVERLIEVFDITNRQDVALSERNQAGVRSSHYRPGPNSMANEAGVHEFLRFCEQRLAAAAEADAGHGAI